MLMISHLNKEFYLYNNCLREPQRRQIQRQSKGQHTSDLYAALTDAALLFQIASMGHARTCERHKSNTSFEYNVDSMLLDDLDTTIRTVSP
jgi:hypothetical protein